MPMIYGEGKKAFRRLQLEIMKESNDQSIFAWTGTGEQRGPLAASPAEFRKCGRVRRYYISDRGNPEYAMTNKGLRISLPIIKEQDPPITQQGRIYSALLNCSNEYDLQIGIYLRKDPFGEYIRIDCLNTFGHYKLPLSKVEIQELYLLDPSSSNFTLTDSIRPSQEIYVFTISWESLLENGFNLLPDYHGFDVLWHDRSYPGKLIFCWYNGGRAEKEFTFTKTDQAVVFKVVFGIANRLMWCNIEPDWDLLPERWYSSKDREELGMGEDGPFEFSHRRMARMVALDRLSLPVSDDLSGSVAIRPGFVDGEKGVLANVSVSRIEEVELEID